MHESMFLIRYYPNNKKNIYPLHTIDVNKMLSYRRETALQGAL